MAKKNKKKRGGKTAKAAAASTATPAADAASPVAAAASDPVAESKQSPAVPVVEPAQATPAEGTAAATAPADEVVSPAAADAAPSAAPSAAVAAVDDANDGRGSDDSASVEGGDANGAGGSPAGPSSAAGGDDSAEGDKDGAEAGAGAGAGEGEEAAAADAQPVDDDAEPAAAVAASEPAAVEEGNSNEEDNAGDDQTGEQAVSEEKAPADAQDDENTPDEEGEELDDPLVAAKKKEEAEQQAAADAERLEAEEKAKKEAEEEAAAQAAQEQKEKEIAAAEAAAAAALAAEEAAKPKTTFGFERHTHVYIEQQHWHKKQGWHAKPKDAWADEKREHAWPNFPDVDLAQGWFWTDRRPEPQVPEDAAWEEKDRKALEEAAAIEAGLDHPHVRVQEHVVEAAAQDGKSAAAEAKSEGGEGGVAAIKVVRVSEARPDGEFFPPRGWAVDKQVKGADEVGAWVVNDKGTERWRRWTRQAWTDEKRARMAAEASHKAQQAAVAMQRQRKASQLERERNVEQNLFKAKTASVKTLQAWHARMTGHLAQQCGLLNLQREQMVAHAAEGAEVLHEAHRFFSAIVAADQAYAKALGGLKLYGKGLQQLEDEHKEKQAERRASAAAAQPVPVAAPGAVAAGGAAAPAGAAGAGGAAVVAPGQVVLPPEPPRGKPFLPFDQSLYAIGSAQLQASLVLQQLVGGDLLPPLLVARKTYLKETRRVNTALLHVFQEFDSKLQAAKHALEEYIKKFEQEKTERETLLAKAKADGKEAKIGNLPLSHRADFWVLEQAYRHAMVSADKSYAEYRHRTAELLVEFKTAEGKRLQSFQEVLRRFTDQSLRLGQIMQATGETVRRSVRHVDTARALTDLHNRRFVPPPEAAKAAAAAGPGGHVGAGSGPGTPAAASGDNKLLQVPGAAAPAAAAGDKKEEGGEAKAVSARRPSFLPHPASPPVCLLVAKEGLVKRQRSVIHTWVEAYCVLTRDHYLYCYYGSAHPFSTDYEYRFNSSPEQIKAAAEQAAAAQPAAADAKQPAKKDKEPAQAKLGWSVDLRSGHVTAAAVPRKKSKKPVAAQEFDAGCQFEIKLSRSGFFTTLAFKGSWKVVLRAKNPEDMKSWLHAINEPGEP